MRNDFLQKLGSEILNPGIVDFRKYTINRRLPGYGVSEPMFKGNPENSLDMHCFTKPVAFFH
jgi:hypothetical protein